MKDVHAELTSDGEMILCQHTTTGCSVSQTVRLGRGGEGRKDGSPPLSSLSPPPPPFHAPTHTPHTTTTTTTHTYTLVYVSILWMYSSLLILTKQNCKKYFSFLFYFKVCRKYNFWNLCTNALCWAVYRGSLPLVIALAKLALSTLIVSTPDCPVDRTTVFANCTSEEK